MRLRETTKEVFKAVYTQLKYAVRTYPKATALVIGVTAATALVGYKASGDAYGALYGGALALAIVPVNVYSQIKYLEGT